MLPYDLQPLEIQALISGHSTSGDGGLDSKCDCGHIFVIINLPPVHKECRRVLHRELVSCLLSDFVNRMGKFPAPEARDEVNLRHASSFHDLEDLWLDIASAPQALTLKDHAKSGKVLRLWYAAREHEYHQCVLIHWVLTKDVSHEACINVSALYFRQDIHMKHRTASAGN
jgi:hypothetical protein